MIGVLLTLSLCLITAASRVFLKKGLKGSNPFTGVVTSVFVGFIFLSLLAVPRIITHFKQLNLEGVLTFAMIGLVAPPLVRWLSYVGVDRIGASKADPIRSLQPFFALLFSGFFVNEPVGIEIWIATVLIFIGVYFVTSAKPAAEGRALRISDLSYPLAAALVAGLIINARQYGTRLLPDSVVSAFISATSALLVFIVIAIFNRNFQTLKWGAQSKKLLLISGILTASTDVLDLWILKISSVKVVAPLLATTPIFVVLFSHLFLKDEEKVQAKTWVGALLIFIAVQLIVYEVKK